MEDFWQIIGKFPVKCEANIQFVSAENCGSFVRHLIEYNVESNERVRAYLLVPNQKISKLPAVVCHHQHAGEFYLGKSEPAGVKGDQNQFIGKELAEIGFVCLCPDAIGFEERNPLGGPKTQYFELTQRLFRGETLLAKVLHDIKIALDVICEFDFVDRENIGFIGHSYGGRMAIWASAFDKRIKASVSNCGAITFAESCNSETGIQAEFCVPSMLGKFEIWDVANLISPRALRLQTGKRDKWSRGANVFAQQCDAKFQKGQFEWHEYDCGHEFKFEMRNEAYDFLSQKLLK